jgi:hypothetical protein
MAVTIADDSTCNYPCLRKNSFLFAHGMQLAHARARPKRFLAPDAQTLPIFVVKSHGAEKFLTRRCYNAYCGIFIHSPPFNAD